MRANCSDSPPVEPLLDRLTEGPLRGDCASATAPAQASGMALYSLSSMEELTSKPWQQFYSLLAYGDGVLRLEAIFLRMP